MPKVEFIFDKEKDIWNYWSTANGSSKWHDFSKDMPKDIYELIKDRKYEDVKKIIKEKISYIQNKEMIGVFIKALETSWENIEKEYFKRLEKITKKKIYTDKFTAFITTTGRCPYDDKKNWFMVSLFYSLPMSLSTCGHEIMHLQFHHYFWKDVEKEIGYEKTSDLKEALTVLLNLEFEDLWLMRDKGYDSHQELRKFISEEWKKEKDFDKLLKKCIGHLK